MRSSRFSLFAVAALVAIGAAAHAVASTAHDVVTAACRTFRHGIDLVVRTFATPEAKIAAETKPRVVLVAAREFLAKQIQRSRPTVTPRWRMCPSA